ncbi:MAG: hypothetical protein U1A05_03465, partial [Alphaproteobacteria bacterium]|nr:hypothetical protein [Alphaproteobacteria bacterium]
LMIKNGKRYGFEIKLSDAPPVTASMHITVEDLKLDHLYIVNALDAFYIKEERISIVGVSQLRNISLT